MRRNIESALRPVVSAARRWAKSNTTIANLLSDSHNSTQFTNLRSHEIMLSDTVRVEGYRDGLAGSVRAGDVVLDLGAGSGILSLLAAKQKPKKIYAVDHSPFLDVARRIAEANGVTCIEFVQANSRAYTPPELVDVVIHEQMGTALFEENMVENLLDLKARVMKPGGIIAPGQFEVFVEPVTLKRDQVVRYIADIEIEGVDLSMLRDDAGAAHFRPQDYASHPNDGRAAFDYYLAAPAPLIAFDLNTMESPREVPRLFRAARRVVRDGALDGFCIHFRATFPNGVSFDTAPTSRYTHWNNRIVRADGRMLRAGDEIAYTLKAEALADPRLWWIDLV